METHVVTYDIRHPKRLRRVAKTCEDFGCRRQLSVFLCRISAADLMRLKARLEEIIDPEASQVIFIRLCAMCAIEIKALGVPTPVHDVQDVVIVSRGWNRWNIWNSMLSSRKPSALSLSVPLGASLISSTAAEPTRQLLLRVLKCKDGITLTFPTKSILS